MIPQGIKGLEATTIDYCTKVSNGNVRLWQWPPSYSDPIGQQIYAKCDKCSEHFILVVVEDILVFNKLFDFAKKHGHKDEWKMGELTFSGQTKAEPSLSPDIIKLLYKYSNFNVDAQARSFSGIWEYRLVCGKCGAFEVKERTSFIQQLNRLAYEGESNSVREFCKNHSHGTLVFVDDVITEIGGRKFRDE